MFKGALANCCRPLLWKMLIALEVENLAIEQVVRGHGQSSVASIELPRPLHDGGNDDDDDGAYVLGNGSDANKNPQPGLFVRRRLNQGG
jgi:hypothetical protein